MIAPDLLATKFTISPVRRRLLPRAPSAQYVSATLPDRAAMTQWLRQSDNLTTEVVLGRIVAGRKHTWQRDAHHRLLF